MLKAKQAAAGPARQPGVERRKNHPLRAKNGHLHVLLTQPVPHVGQPGEVVNVRPGFGRNYLLPQGLATFATPHNLLIVEKHRQRLKKQEELRADLSEPGCSDRPAVPHHRGQRQRGRAPLRLGQRRPDRRRAQVRGFPDRDRVGSYRGTAQGPGTLHHQGPLGPGHRHRGQALGRPYPHRRSMPPRLDRSACRQTYAAIQLPQRVLIRSFCSTNRQVASSFQDLLEETTDHPVGSVRSRRHSSVPRVGTGSSVSRWLNSGAGMQVDL